VRAPWVRECVFGHWGDEQTYIIPNRDWVVLGGTGQVGDWRTVADVDDAEAIMERAAQVRQRGLSGLTQRGAGCGPAGTWLLAGPAAQPSGAARCDAPLAAPPAPPQLLPSLADAELLDHWVGLRPGRCARTAPAGPSSHSRCNHPRAAPAP
jgi:hypothetical protein